MTALTSQRADGFARRSGVANVSTRSRMSAAVIEIFAQGQSAPDCYTATQVELTCDAFLPTQLFGGKNAHPENR
jgi:hypothetical protein